MLAEVLLGGTVVIPLQFTNAAGAAKNPTSVVARVYDEDGIVQTVTLATMNGGSVTGTVTNPNGTGIVVPSTAHGLAQYMRVSTSGITGHGVAGVNGDHEITAVNTNDFTLSTVGNNGATGTGGNWWVTGLYKATLTCSIGNGYDKGRLYFLHITYKIGSDDFARVFTFQVV